LLKVSAAKVSEVRRGAWRDSIAEASGGRYHGSERSTAELLGIAAPEGSYVAFRSAMWSGLCRDCSTPAGRSRAILLGVGRYVRLWGVAF
jgi:hypothetical protein